MTGQILTISDYLPMVSNFSMSKYEITRGQWNEVMSGILPTSSSMAPTTGTADNNPVNCVNWYDAIAFCNKLSIKERKTPCYSVKVGGQEVDWENLSYDQIPTSSNTDWDNATCDFDQNGYRLPTEAEWEYAARGGINLSFFTYSGSKTVGEVAWYKDNSNSATHEVGDSSKIANALGIYDMSGNVWEWCWDRYASTYDKSTTINPTGVVSGSSRVGRGGAWNEPDSACAVAYRYSFSANLRASVNGIYYGLRIVCRP